MRPPGVQHGGANSRHAIVRNPVVGAQLYNIYIIYKYIYVYLYMYISIYISLHLAVILLDMCLTFWALGNFSFEGASEVWLFAVRHSVRVTINRHRAARAARDGCHFKSTVPRLTWTRGDIGSI